MHQPLARQPGGDLGPEAAGQRRFMDDDAAAGFLHRGKNAVHIQGFQGGDIDDFGLDAFAGQNIGGLHRFAQHRAPADQRNVRTLQRDEAAVERQGAAIVDNRLPGRPVGALGLQKDDRVRIANGGQQQTVGLRRRGRDDDADARNVGEHRLRAFRVMFRRMDAAAIGRAEHHRTGQPSTRAGAHPRGMVHQLVDHRIDEAHELDFGDRTEPHGRQPDRQAADQRLRQRRIAHARLAETGDQAFRRPEHAAVYTDILAQQDDGLVFRHGAGQRPVQRLHHGQVHGFRDGLCLLLRRDHRFPYSPASISVRWRA